jgi:hypothetical protein
VVGSAPVHFAPALRLALAACALVTIVLAVVVYRDLAAPEWLFTWLFVATGFAAIWRRPFHQVLHGIDTPERDLGLLAGLLARIESERFSSARLTALHQALLTDGVLPSTRIAQLRRLVCGSTPTHNMMFAPCSSCCCARSWRSQSIAGTRRTDPRSPNGCGRSVSSRRSRRWRLAASGEDPFRLAEEGPILRSRGARSSIDCGGDRGAERRAPRWRRAARDHRQRLEHVGEEHAASVGGRQRLPWRAHP